jgi:hypothetical protein
MLSSVLRNPQLIARQQKTFLRPFLACGGLRFPVSAQRYRFQVPVGRASLRRQKSRSRQPIDDNGSYGAVRNGQS